jgi:hypothetical protein
MRDGAALGVVRVAGIAVVGIVACVGCEGAREARVEAPVDLAIAPIGSLPVAKITSSGESDATCSFRLVAGQINKTSPSCYLDEHVSDGPGLLHYPCSGDGPAEAVFGEHHYMGHVSHGQLELSLSTELDWDDGCRWGTQAAISGTVATGTGGAGASNAPTVLSWDYLDRVIRGSDCSGVCRARTSIRVVPAKAHAGVLEGVQRDDDD